MQIRGLFRKNNPALFFSVRVADMLAVVVGGLLAYWWKFDDNLLLVRYQIPIFLAAGLALIVFPQMGVYRGWRGKNVLHNIHLLFTAWVTVLLSLMVIAFLTKTSTFFSREWLLTWAVFSPPILLFFRMLLYLFIARIRERGWHQVNVLVVGAGDLGQDVARRIKLAEWTGFGIVAFFDDDPALQGQPVEGVPVQGHLKDLADFLQQRDEREVFEVWLALPLRAEGEVKAILHDLRHLPVAIRYIPDIFGFRLINYDVSQIGGIPIIDLNVTPMVGTKRFVKAVEDWVLAAIILVLISPLMLCIAIGVKLSSPGPVFYRQERVSWNGASFQMLKFRSMPVEAERRTGPVWARAGEQRATRFGAFLRKTSLDELPQFINVLKGEMSIVGPRPERPVFVDKFKDEIPDYMMKHMVKGGITGWAQINGWRGNTDLEKRIEYDMYYIENWSLWFDLRIIFFTVFKGLVNKNAY